MTEDAMEKILRDQRMGREPTPPRIVFRENPEECARICANGHVWFYCSHGHAWCSSCGGWPCGNPAPENKMLCSRCAQ